MWINAPEGFLGLSLGGSVGSLDVDGIIERWPTRCRIDDSASVDILRSSDLSGPDKGAVGY